MRTRIKDLGPGRFSFQYTLAKHPNPIDGVWHHVSDGTDPVAWPSAARRDRARQCFTHRKSVDAAMADLRAACLLPTSHFANPKGSS